MFDLCEVEDHPGFYSIPNFPMYAVNTSGVVLNIKKVAILHGGINGSGYHQVRIKHSNGLTYTWGIHRILAYVFKHPGIPIDNLVVNHKNGNKLDNTLDNLEWVTQLRNIEHAGEKIARVNCKPISAHTVDTGEVLYFSTIAGCGRHFNISETAMSKRYETLGKIVFPEGVQYRDAHIKGPWEHPKYIGPVGKDIPVLVKFLDTGLIVQYDSQRDVAQSLGYGDATISIWLNNNKDLPIREGFIQLKRLDDPQSWRVPLLPFTEYYQVTNHRAVGVRDHSVGGKTTIYISGRDCCTALGIKANLLHFRLQSMGQTVYSDNRSYFYLDEYESCPIKRECLIDPSLIARIPRKNAQPKRIVKTNT